MFKPFLVIAGVAVAGIVGYKIIKKKNPNFFKNFAANIEKGTDNFFTDASKSFKEGYASTA